MKTIKVVDEDTLEMREVVIEEEGDKDVELSELTPREADRLYDIFSEALGCDSDEFGLAYDNLKKAEAEFNKLYDPFKERLIRLHEQQPDLPKTVIAGGVKVTYISPSVRNTIDSKKLKEEEPELAKKFTKTSKVSASVRLEKA